MSLSSMGTWTPMTRGSLNDGTEQYAELQTAKDPFPYQAGKDRETPFRILYGNTTSFKNERIQSHLFEKTCRNRYSAFCFVESKVKKTEKLGVSNLLAQHKLHSAVSESRAWAPSEFPFAHAAFRMCGVVAEDSWTWTGGSAT